MSQTPIKKVVLIVAHPDDETLWAAGTLFCHPGWQRFVACLCRQHDTDRAPRFYEALKILNAAGIMGDLDDGPEQKPLAENEVENAIMNLVPPQHFDLIITHNPCGEYTKHLRHEEISKAVIQLWDKRQLSADALWTFAYEDGNKTYYPKPIVNATLYQSISKRNWQRKYNLITKTYGFETDSWEARTTPRAEAFWQFQHAADAIKWLDNSGILL